MNRANMWKSKQSVYVLSKCTTLPAMHKVTKPEVVLNTIPPFF